MKGPQWETLKNFHFKPAHTSIRLAWAIENVDKLKETLKKSPSNVCFGCVDTWIVWKLTGGKTWAAEHSCLSTTGMYDAYDAGDWHKLILKLLKIPTTILPSIVDTVSKQYGETDQKSIGHAIPITAVVRLILVCLSNSK